LLYRWLRKIFLLILLGLMLVFLVNSSWFVKLFYPYPHREIIETYAKEYAVDPYLVLAIIRTESRFHTKADSIAGAKGLMQIMPETGDWIARQMKLDGYSREKLYDPGFNIQMGIWYLTYLDKNFRGNLPKMLAAYNAGEQKVRKWLNEGTWTGNLQDTDQIPYPETRDYVDRVLFDYQVYKRIYK